MEKLVNIPLGGEELACLGGGIRPQNSYWIGPFCWWRIIPQTIHKPDIHFELCRDIHTFPVKKGGRWDILALSGRTIAHRIRRLGMDRIYS